ncbi:hypothetical protein [Paenibacillus pabuli]|uniref:hypothetical protein n=1 Tax=Paenibacillus pabuli TaxID=1472 RepID=UPI001FFF9EC0|nr:hypothetical protein [Paenibacillus pabuli]UPK42459.1 hypothetical protein KET34_25210 [Paenibacillus pabuli]
MKKVFVSFLAGAVLMFSAQAFGDGISFTGKKVEGETPVTINGHEVGKAVVINGKSFAPVREITGGFGGKVDSANSEVIALSSQDDSATKTSNDQINYLKKQIELQKNTVESRETEVSNLEKQVAEFKAKADAETGEVQRHRTNYAVFKKSLEDAESRLESEKSKLADLESQLAALK